jgi:hypothetical protein
VLFPRLRDIVSGHEFDAIGEEMERHEHQHFGEDGFEKAVAQVSELEKKVGLYDLAAGALGGAVVGGGYAGPAYGYPAYGAPAYGYGPGPGYYAGPRYVRPYYRDRHRNHYYH